MELTFYTGSSLIIDFMALLILVGMIIYTTLYRRRGKPEDKVFFALILADMVVSAADGLFYVLMGLGIENAVTAAVCGFISIAALDVFMLLLSIYLILRMGLERDKARKVLPFMWIPTALHIILLATSIYMNYWSDKIYNGFILTATSYGFLVYSPILVYSLITLAIAYRKNKRVLILFFVLVVPLVFFVMTSISTIVSLGLAVYLVYAHLYTMRDEFYEEAENHDV